MAESRQSRADGIARTPETMRGVNEMIWETLARGDRHAVVAFFCECESPGCYQPVWLTLETYEQSRRDPAWTALADIHRPARPAAEPAEAHT